MVGTLPRRTPRRRELIHLFVQLVHQGTPVGLRGQACYARCATDCRMMSGILSERVCPRRPSPSQQCGSAVMLRGGDIEGRPCNVKPSTRFCLGSVWWRSSKRR